jgi:hypothetical protein
MLSYKTVLLALLLSSSSLALPIRREVPQGKFNFIRMHNEGLMNAWPTEHSHQAILAAVQTSLVKNNPDGIADSVFGLLGNAAAAGGLGKLTVSCPHSSWTLFLIECYSLGRKLSSAINR